ncbi:hypothetical protein T05_15135 [Trichinella murrelli]|uniref:Uncharacterized protein n=1 Tax=Trichinella murrelli TaxID=144512 RepID=A0A0V0SRY4_9BILA|nr:hypothetical protein T05_15135 [Trichinella murrelli]
MLIHRKAAKLILSRNSANMLEFYAIFLCFWQVDFSSFSVHLE